MRRALPAFLAALVLALPLRRRRRGDSGGDAKPRLTVSAAASLKNAFEAYGKEFPDATARFSFAGSDELAAQIRKGVKPDVFAAANTKLPDQLYDEGKVGSPRSSPATAWCWPCRRTRPRSRAWTTWPSRASSWPSGAESVPVGSYTREVLGRLPARPGEGDPGQRALQRAGRQRRGRQAHPGRRRRRASST